MGRWTLQCVCVMFIMWLECLLSSSKYQLGTRNILWLHPMDLAKKRADGRIQVKGNAVLFCQLGDKCGSYDPSVLGLAGF